MADTKRVCISCGSRARFSVTVLIGTLVTEPRKMLSSTVAMCDDCSKPGSPNYRKFASDLALLAWMKRNDLLKLMETIPPPVDAETAAAGNHDTN